MFCAPTTQSTVCFNLQPYAHQRNEVDPNTAQFVWLASMQKLDQAKRSRSGIKLRRGLLIAVTALKAKQLLWERDSQYGGFSLTLPQINPLVGGTANLWSGNIVGESDRGVVANPVWPECADQLELNMDLSQSESSSIISTPFGRPFFASDDDGVPIEYSSTGENLDDFPENNWHWDYATTATTSCTTSCNPVQQQSTPEFPRPCLEIG